ncbi:hypothetical protein [Methylobacterium nonmethylotrophicum]|uniref:Uncharacterized protein n=1 Tax=Methylobacterium nonmethylotrophicum TaxID=1141884 RepID=A0A4Z0NPF8_9HYPH|nr:hypothetical protein [Methylobacterium nonmethylotrophicum]TGD98730.1 hypothetical protein EU555_15475 [Methylobacterium nonmethylotrophicum]
MAINERELLEDLAYQEAEGAAEIYADDADSADLLGSDAAEGEQEDGFDGAEADWGEEEDGFDGMDGYESETDSLEEGDALEEVMAAALSAEEEDEFFGKIVSGIRRALPVVGKIARAAAPVLSVIPHPAAQAAATAARLIGKLRAEGASEEEALEAVAELAARDRRALPVVAGLAARAVMKQSGTQLSGHQRRQAVRTMNRAAQALVRQGGPSAVRALPKVARSVLRTTVSKGTPAALRPRVVASTAAKVSQNPALLRRLAQPSPHGQRLLRRLIAGGGQPGAGHRGVGGPGSSRTLRVSGPGEIRIVIG